jgi:hypothetical protein
MGNHVEPIVFLIALFCTLCHPMTFVVVQNAALATMGPVGFDIAKRLGSGCRNRVFNMPLLVIPPPDMSPCTVPPRSAGAPLLLLMFRARLLRSLTQHWVWFIAYTQGKYGSVACRYCAVHAVIDRKHELAEACMVSVADGPAFTLLAPAPA